MGEELQHIRIHVARHVHADLLPRTLQILEWVPLGNGGQVALQPLPFCWRQGVPLDQARFVDCSFIGRLRLNDGKCGAFQGSLLDGSVY